MAAAAKNAAKKSQPRLYTDAERKRKLPEGHPDAAFLLDSGKKSSGSGNRDWRDEALAADLEKPAGEKSSKKG